MSEELRPRAALLALRASIVVAIAAEIDGVKAMVSTDLRLFLEFVDTKFKPSERIVMRVVWKPENICANLGDNKGLLVQTVSKFPSEQGIFWIDASRIKGFDPNTLTPGAHIFAQKRGEKYQAIPIEERY